MNCHDERNCTVKISCVFQKPYQSFLFLLLLLLSSRVNRVQSPAPVSDFGMLFLRAREWERSGISLYAFVDTPTLPVDLELCRSHPYRKSSCYSWMLEMEIGTRPGRSSACSCYVPSKACSCYAPSKASYSPFVGLAFHPHGTLDLHPHLP